MLDTFQSKTIKTNKINQHKYIHIYIYIKENNTINTTNNIYNNKNNNVIISSK